MKKSSARVAWVAAAFLVAGCSDPLARFGQVEPTEGPQADLVADADEAGLLAELAADAEETADGTDAGAEATEEDAPQGLFARLFRPADVDEQSLEPVDGSAAEVADPAAEPTPAPEPQTDLAEAADSQPDETETDAPRQGLFARLFRPAEAPDAAAPETDAATVQADTSDEPPAPVDRAEDAPETAVAEAADVALQEPVRAGFFGFLRRSAPPAPAGEDADAPTQDAKAPDEEDATVVAAALPDQDQTQPEEPEPTRRGGFFAGLFGGGGARGPEGAQARETEGLSPGGTLPFGTMARVCAMSRGDLGTRVARHPEQGPVRYALYDTDPGSEDPRAFYLTGFQDGCARQVTAAVASFGQVQVYEILRYGAPADSLPSGATDTAYDRIKRQVCGVSRRKPCGDAIDDLAATTVFVSVYPRFGSNPDWQTLLLHDGDVAALDVKSQ